MDLFVYALGLCAFALLCYFKAVPHATGEIVASITFPLSLLFLVSGGIHSRVYFLKIEQIAKVDLMFFGITVSEKIYEYKNINFSVRFISGIRMGKTGGMVGTPRAWISANAGGLVFVFDRALGKIITEDDLAKFKDELGF